MKSNTIGDYLENEKFLGYLLMAPALLILLIFIAYPFCLGVWLSFTDKLVGKPAAFIGFKNFVAILDSQIFRRTIQNTFIFTASATFLKFVLGLALALLLNQKIPFKRLLRASCLLPWIVPTVLSCIAWLWMLDTTYSVFNWILIKLGVIKWGVMWLGDATLAMISIKSTTSVLHFFNSSKS